MSDETEVVARPIFKDVRLGDEVTLTTDYKDRWTGTVETIDGDLGIWIGDALGLLVKPWNLVSHRRPQ